MVMTELLSGYLPVILIAALIAIIVAFLVIRPRQRVRLTDSAPLRPHMTSHSRPMSKDLGRQAASNVTGELIGGPFRQHVAGGVAAADDLVLLKGIGPKLAEVLHEHGFTRFEQLSHLTPEEIDLLDQQLGAFRGRIRRDRIVDQAAFLARGDIDGFEEHFGKL